MNNITWYAPKLQEYDLRDIVKKISIKASSQDGMGNNAEMCLYHVLSEGEGSVECGGFPEGSGGDVTYCLEYGPLNGCDYSLVCSASGIVLFSNENNYLTD